MQVKLNSNVTKDFINKILLVVTMADKVIRKAFINKRTKQLSVTVPKRELKKMNPDLKFGDELFVELKILKRKKK